MSDLGTAYVQIVPSAQGISKGIQSAIGNPIEQSAPVYGSKLANGLSKGLKSIGGAMTSYITKPALGVVAALGGLTLFSGWKRMTEIDNAKVKLQAIGNSAQDMEKITNSALESVKGTAYGMDAAMTTSAAAVAAGIKPGQELTKYLTAISDASAVAGVDMASMGAIFNKVATSGKAQNDVLGQMADAGIPIYQYLAEQMGVTSDKVFDMAKNGEIGLSDFQNAVSSHIGGAAKEIGSKTITGAIANVKASISRIGANFLGSADDADSFAGKILPMLNNLMENLEPIEEKAKELGSQFADAFMKFVDVISQIPLPVLAGLAGALVGIGPALTIIGKAIPIINAAMTILPASLAGVIAPLAAIAAAFALIYIKSEAFRNAINNLAGAVAKAMMPVIKAAGEFLKIFIKEVMSVASAIGNALAPVIKLITPVVLLLAKIFATKLTIAFKVAGAIVKTVANAIKAAAAIIQGVATGLGQIFGTIAKTISKNGGKIKDAITKPFSAAKDFISGAIEKIKSFFPLHIGKIFSGMKLPHFKISGGKAPFGLMGKGTKPSIDVSWYAKGGIMSQPTLFGGGEAGDEAIVPLDPFWKKLEEAGGNTFNITMNVDGAENPDLWARRFTHSLELEMRAL